MMKDEPPQDPFLEALGETARREAAQEDERFDERWNRLVRGELSEEEEEALRAEVEESDDPERLGDYEVLRPLGEDFRNRMVLRLAEQRQRRHQEPGGNVVSLEERRSALRRWLPAAAGLAAVLLVALVGVRLWWSGGGAEPLPLYTAQLQGAVSEERSGTPTVGAVPTFLLGQEFVLSLDPLEEIGELLDFRFFLRREGGPPHLWEVGVFRSPGGGVEVRGILAAPGSTVEGEIEIIPGDWELTVVYGRPGHLPEEEVIFAGDGGQRAEDWVHLPPLRFRVERGAAASTEMGDPDVALQVEYSGCYAVSPGPTCVPSSRNHLSLWVRTPQSSEIEVWVGSRRLEETGVRALGGRRFEVPVRVEDREVRVRATSPFRKDEEWRLAIVSPGLPQGLRSALGQAATPGADPRDVRGLLEPFLEDADPKIAGLAHDTLGRMRVQGWHELLERAVVLNRQAGQIHQEVLDVGRLAFEDIQRGNLLRAEERLAEVRLPEYAPADVKFQLAYHQGLVTRGRGRYGDALAAFDEAVRATQRVDSPMQVQALQGLAGTLLELNRVEEAQEIYRRSAGEATRACDRARHLSNHAWILIQAGLRGEGHPDPHRQLEQAGMLAEREGCGAGLLLHIRLNQALAHARAGRSLEAWQALEGAESLHESARPVHQIWELQIRGELAHLAGDAAGSLAFHREQEAVARRHFLPAGYLRARLGQARALEILGNPAEALAILNEAEGFLESAVLKVPIQAGRDRFVAQHEEVASRQLALLLQDGREAEALAVARRSRSRVLRSLFRGHRLAYRDSGEQAGWQVELEAYKGLWEGKEGGWERRRQEAETTFQRVLEALALPSETEALPALRNGELTLLYHPLPRDWIGFAADAQGVVTTSVTLPDEILEDPQELSRRLLQPFADQIRRAERIRILPMGSLQRIDFHALPWEGDVLIQTKPVVYGLDIDRNTGGPADRTFEEGEPRALAIAGAGLRAAALEVGEVRRGLTALSRPWQVDALEPDATAKELVRGLSGTYRLVHYAGHGVFEGLGGWGSALVLNRHHRVSLGEILALGRTPRWVVLSSCESARADEAVSVAGLGLGQAFLVAGAEQVVAAVRPVGDQAAFGLFQQFYRDWDSRGDFAERFRRAQLRWRREHPEDAWASFRVLEP